MLLLLSRVGRCSTAKYMKLYHPPPPPPLSLSASQPPRSSVGQKVEGRNTSYHSPTRTMYPHEHKVHVRRGYGACFCELAFARVRLLGKCASTRQGRKKKQPRERHVKLRTRAKKAPSMVYYLLLLKWESGLNPTSLASSRPRRSFSPAARESEK